MLRLHHPAGPAPQPDVAPVRRRVLEGGAREHPPGSCFICHSTEHRIHNCPKLPQDIKRAIKESKKKKDSEDA